MKITKDASLKKYSGYGCGGRADRLLEAETRQELKNAVGSFSGDDRWTVLGRGYNTLVSDRGFRGTVIVLGGDFRKMSAAEEVISVSAAASLPELVKLAGDLGLEGAEFLAGIPGTVGAAVVCNAGIPGSEISDIIEEIEVLEVPGAGYSVLGKDKVRFGYRYCSLDGKSIITGCRIRLKKGIKSKIMSRIQEYLDTRKKRQPYEYKSCGSVFKNPDNGNTPAAKLIDEAGLAGHRIGDAQVSPKHVNFIVNLKNAASEDIWSLIKFVKGRVKETSGKDLELEIRLLGEGFEN
ncbi:MAG: UDP-N-acetylmuramate dehydrogenase [Elusimicrobia bacterium]|nr:UDP-N-acetylmuramate dehydrogenase [Elusimicrobiota bacterium]